MLTHHYYPESTVYIKSLLLVLRLYHFNTSIQREHIQFPILTDYAILYIFYFSQFNDTLCLKICISLTSWASFQTFNDYSYFFSCKLPVLSLCPLGPPPQCIATLHHTVHSNYQYLKLTVHLCVWLPLSAECKLRDKKWFHVAHNYNSRAQMDKWLLLQFPEVQSVVKAGKVISLPHNIAGLS